MAAPKSPRKPPVNVEASEGRPHPLIDRSNSGNWGEVDKTALFPALSRIIAIADPTVTEFAPCEPVNLVALIENLAGVDEAQGSAAQWDQAIADGPAFNDVDEPVVMSLRRRRPSEARDIRAARRLRGLPEIVMALSASAAVADSVEPDADPLWGDIDAKALFPAINALIQKADPDRTTGEFPVCEPKDLATKLKDVAGKLERRSRQKEPQQPVQMSMRPKPKAPAKQFTEAERAAARRLRGMK